MAETDRRTESMLTPVAGEPIYLQYWSNGDRVQNVSHVIGVYTPP